MDTPGLRIFKSGEKCHLIVMSDHGARIHDLLRKGAKKKCPGIAEHFSFKTMRN